MSKKYRARGRKQTSPPRRMPWLWLALGSALLLIVGGLSALWASSEPEPAVAPLVTGGPKLAVDQAVIDEGPVKLIVAQVSA